MRGLAHCLHVFNVYDQMPRVVPTAVNKIDDADQQRGASVFHLRYLPVHQEYCITQSKTETEIIEIVQ